MSVAHHAATPVQQVQTPVVAAAQPQVQTYSVPSTYNVKPVVYQNHHTFQSVAAAAPQVYTYPQAKTFSYSAPAAVHNVVPSFYTSGSFAPTFYTSSSFVRPVVSSVRHVSSPVVYSAPTQQVVYRSYDHDDLDDVFDFDD